MITVYKQNYYNFENLLINTIINYLFTDNFDTKQEHKFLRNRKKMTILINIILLIPETMVQINISKYFNCGK